MENGGAAARLQSRCRGLHDTCMRVSSERWAGAAAMRARRMSSSQEHPCAFDRIRFAPLAVACPLDNDYRFNLGSRHLVKEAKWLRESEYAAASAGRGGGGNPRLGEAEVDSG